MLPFWDAMRVRRQAAMRGNNAAVVGILSAPLAVWTSAVLTPRDLPLRSGFLLLTVWKLPSWVVVVLLAGAGTLSRLA